MNANIKKAIFSTFKFDVGVSDGIVIEKLKVITGLPEVYRMLDDRTMSQKTVMLALEDVVLRIKLKDRPTTLESLLLQQLSSLVYNPPSQSSYGYK